jgi:hypothetical protein
MFRSFFLAVVMISYTAAKAQCVGDDTEWQAAAMITKQPEKSSTVDSAETHLHLSEKSLSQGTLRYHPKKYRYKSPAENYQEYAITSGTWIPTGWNQALGVHPLLGFAGGVWHNRMLYELNMEFRFVETPRDYTVIYQGAPLSQKKYFGGYLGMHVGYGFICQPMTTVYGLVGIGYDGFDAVEGDDTHDPLSINSVNFNVGSGIRHFNKDGGFIGIEATYDVINYNNPGGTLLNGNAVTVRLVWGGVF